jgi:hypothetical protein
MLLLLVRGSAENTIREKRRASYFCCWKLPGGRNTSRQLEGNPAQAFF